MSKSMWKRLLAVLALISLVAAACGNDDDPDTSSPAAGTEAPAANEQQAEGPSGAETEPEPADEAPDSGEPDAEESDMADTEAPAPETTSDLFGEPNPATGEPLKVGFVSDGRSDAIDNSAEIPAAQAAAAYANDYLGGVAGRPIEFITCETGQTPAGAQDCVAELAQAGVVAILNGVSGQGEVLSAQANEAGIPYVANGGLSQAIFNAPMSFVIGNGLGALVGPAAVASEKGLTKVGIIVIDVPAAVEPVSQAAPLFYGNVGVEADIIAVAPGTPDMTPQVQAAIINDAQQFAIIGDETFCISAMQAIQTLGFEGETIVVRTCIGEATVDQVDVDGIRVVTGTSDDMSDPEVALYHAVMDEYGGTLDTIAEGGYSAVLSWVRAMAGHGDSEVTPESVVETMLAMEPAPLPIGAQGSTFQCNRMAVAIAPAICSPGFAIYTLDEDGRGTGTSFLDLTAVLTLGG
ncbi:MAG: ABC transporter substrate-binding protein [bacterium]|nr:ABC transporter substrate-binding protein [bacterium]